MLLLQAPPPGDQYMTRREHNQVLMTLGHGPHGYHAIQAYLKRHSNRFLFDFNERILEATAERRRQASMGEDDLHA